MTDFHHDYHAHDDQNNCLDDDGEIMHYAVAQQSGPPEYPISGYDLVGVAVVAIGNGLVGIFNAISASAQTIGASVVGTRDLASQEFFAAARHQRTRRDESRRMRLLADDLASLERGEVS